MVEIPLLSPQTVERLVEIISGGKEEDKKKFPNKNYRTRWQIVGFLENCDIDFSFGQGTRIPTLRTCLSKVNRDEKERKKLGKVIEAASNPCDFPSNPEEHQSVVDALNEVLKQDDLELLQVDGRMRLYSTQSSLAAMRELQVLSAEINFDSVCRDLERVRENVINDPADAITSACAIVESVCINILNDLEIEYPRKMGVKSLYEKLRTPLGLSPSNSSLEPERAPGINLVLSGLINVIDGIGALRNRHGDAHGRERGRKRVDSRIATLCVDASCSVSQFLIETWKKKYPDGGVTAANT